MTCMCNENYLLSNSFYRNIVRARSPAIVSWPLSRLIWKDVRPEVNRVSRCTWQTRGHPRDPGVLVGLHHQHEPYLQNTDTARPLPNPRRPCPRVCVCIPYGEKWMRDVSYHSPHDTHTQTSAERQNSSFPFVKYVHIPEPWAPWLWPSRLRQSSVTPCEASSESTLSR